MPPSPLFQSSTCHSISNVVLCLQFHISVEAINVASEGLEDKLHAQARFVSQHVDSQYDAVQQARNAIARFDVVRERSAALLGSKESDLMGELPVTCSCPRPFNSSGPSSLWQEGAQRASRS